MSKVLICKSKIVLSVCTFLYSFRFIIGTRLASIGAYCSSTSTVDNDGLDNDCDGLIDEEFLNGVDDDGDGLIGKRDIKFSMSKYFYSPATIKGWISKSFFQSFFFIYESV